MQESQMGEGDGREGQKEKERQGYVPKPLQRGSSLRKRKLQRFDQGLLHRAWPCGSGGSTGLGCIQRNGAERRLVLGKILAQQAIQRLGLLWAEIDALEVLQLAGIGAGLGEGAEDQVEVPDRGADLDAVGIAVAEVGGLGHRDTWLGTGAGLICFTHSESFLVARRAVRARKKAEGQPRSRSFLFQGEVGAEGGTRTLTPHGTGF